MKKIEQRAKIEREKYGIELDLENISQHNAMKVTLSAYGDLVCDMVEYLISTSGTGRLRDGITPVARIISLYIVSGKPYLHGDLPKLEG